MLIPTLSQHVWRANDFDIQSVERRNSPLARTFEAIRVHTLQRSCFEFGDYKICRV